VFIRSPQSQHAKNRQQSHKQKLTDACLDYYNHTGPITSPPVPAKAHLSNILKSPQWHSWVTAVHPCPPVSFGEVPLLVQQHLYQQQMINNVLHDIFSLQRDLLFYTIILEPLYGMCMQFMNTPGAGRGSTISERILT
jgi:hypothetical protein